MLAAFMVACTEGPVTGPGDAPSPSDFSLQVEPGQAEGAPGETIQFEATLLDDSGDPVSASHQISWSSSDTLVATVDGDGLATVRDSGSATVVATATSQALDGEVSEGATVRGLAAQVEELSIAPGSITVDAGDSVDLDATVRDGAGNEIDRDASWSSSDTSVATVDADGIVTGQSEGAVTVAASVGGESDTADVTVAAPGSSNPPSMPAGLSVAEEDRTDGDVTYAASWGGSSSASRYDWNGGSNSGRWSDDGSTQSTSVEFTAPRSGSADDSFFCVQAVNADGSSENNCTPFTVPAEPTSGGGDEVASVTVSPGSASLSSVGGTAQFSAEARNGSGDLLSGVSISWSTSNSSVITVDADGTVTAQDDGTADVTAEADGVTGSASVTVDIDGGGGGGGGSWSFRQNEPAGYGTITEDDYDNTSGPWSFQNGSGSWSIASPSGEPSVTNGAQGAYRAHYPSGGSDGSDFSNSWRAGSDLVNFYWAYTIRFSPGWIHHTNMVKHALWIWGGEIGGFLGFRLDDGGIYPEFTTSHANCGKLRVAPKSVHCASEEDGIDAADSDAFVTTGEWHQIEFQVASSTSDSRKDFRVWLDGVLVLEQLDVPVDEGPHVGQRVKELKFANTWGGGGQDVPQSQFIDVGHTYVSGSN